MEPDLEEKFTIVIISVENSRITLDWCREKIVFGHATGYFCHGQGHPAIAPNSVWASIERLVELYDRYRTWENTRTILVLKFEDKNKAMECRLKFG